MDSAGTSRAGTSGTSRAGTSGTSRAGTSGVKIEIDVAEETPVAWSTAGHIHTRSE